MKSVCCAQCGTEFTVHGHRGALPKYCSPQCRQRRNHLASYAPRSAVSFPDCPFCNEVFCARTARTAVPMACRNPECRRALKAQQQRQYLDRYRVEHGHGYPRHRPPAPGAVRGAEHHRWRGEDITYNSAHMRVIRLYGPACTHQCADCLDEAQDWSYDYTDPQARVDDQGRPYSTDPQHYSPRCRGCHKVHDNAAKTS